MWTMDHLPRITHGGNYIYVDVARVVSLNVSWVTMISACGWRREWACMWTIDHLPRITHGGNYIYVDVAREWSVYTIPG